jgi:DNA-directed RNA polymerase subunit RPC12/RpoP/phosphatidylglycerophosphatase A
MTQAEKQKWEVIRVKGQARYVLVEGILRRGILSGAIFALVPFMFGQSTHAYRMTVLGLLILFIVLSLLCGICLGVLFWCLQENSYQRQTSDNHSADLKFISRDELIGIWKKINRRALLRRFLTGICLLAIIFGGLCVLPRSSPDRDYYLWADILIFWTFFVLIVWFNNREIKKDSSELGAICPKCKKPLYSLIASPKNYRCPHCGYELFQKV